MKERICIRCKSKFEPLCFRRTKYCYACLPSGENAGKLHKESKNGKALKCGECGRLYVYREHSYNRSTKVCGKCKLALQRTEFKTKIVELAGGKCWGCGYDRCMKAMVFHHMKPGSKDFALSKRHYYSWKRIKLEIEKCALLCANCHAEVHSGIRECPTRYM